MTAIDFDEALLAPLKTDDDIERRVAGLIGRANTRQLWLLFLDGDDVQLPQLIPIGGLPSQPDDEGTARVLGSIGEVMADIGAVSIVSVWERYGPQRLTPQDAAWARSLDRGCRQRGITLRGMLLSHRMGVSWIAAADYATSAAGGAAGG